MTYEDVLDSYGYIFWKTVGISMKPLIKEGRDTVLINKRPKERLKKYDVVLFKRSNIKGRGSYVLHRILRVNPDGTYWIVGDNCTSGEIVKEENILGVLASVKNSKRTVNVKDFRYKLYTHLWCDCYRARFFILKSVNLLRRSIVRLKLLVTRSFPHNR